MWYAYNKEVLPEHCFLTKLAVLQTRWFDTGNFTVSKKRMEICYASLIMVRNQRSHFEQLVFDHNYLKIILQTWFAQKGNYLTPTRPVISVFKILPSFIFYSSDNDTQLSNENFSDSSLLLE